MVGAHTPSVDPGSDVPTIDPTVLEGLRNVLPEPVVREIVENYITDITRCVTMIADAGTFAPDDHEMLNMLFERGHELKGCAGQVGAARLHAMAVELEAACKAGMNSDFGPFYRIAELQVAMPAELALMTAALS